MKISGIKKIAKIALKGDRWRPILVLIVGNFIGAWLPFILSGPMEYGINDYFMKSLLAQDRKLGDIFSGFKCFRKTFLISLLKSIYIALWGSIPFIGPVIAFVKGFSYSQAYLVLRDNPTITANKAITISRQIMNGYKAKYFGLSLSFIGWMILDIFTYGILGLLYIAPYKKFSQVTFYSAIKQ